MLEKGTLVDGKYRVLTLIGQGGMSNVYLVLNERANKQWALKEARKEKINNDRIIKQTTAAEIRILTNLRHEYLPTITDVIDRPENDSIYILMDYIEGVTLSRVLKDEGAQSQQNVIKWMKQLCSVLMYLHEQDPPIIYRDLKPSNVMLKPNGDITLIDFGTAKEYTDIASETTSLGTRGYAAPEQLIDSESGTDERTDIYSLGETVYHLLTNHSPAVYPFEIRPIREYNPELSEGLEAIILKCTQNNPDNRYSSSRELLNDLEHYSELDSASIKKTKKMINIVKSLGITGIALIAVGSGMLVYSNSIQEENYGDNVRIAREANSSDAAVDSYLNAIYVSPDKEEAYKELIQDVYLEDNNFTEEEAAELQEILNTKRGDGTIEKALSKSNAQGLVAYDIGIAYYYYYEQEGSKNLARPWLEIAKDSGSLDEAKRTRANVLYLIANYYKNLSYQNKEGDESGDYSVYFSDMETMASLDIASIDNAKTALITYKEVTYQIYAKMVEFEKAGVTRDSIVNLLSTINVAKESITEENLSDLKTEISNNIELATDELNICY